MADQLVNFRIAGRARAVSATVEWLRLVLRVANESRDYPNHRDPGVRRYLDVLIDGEGLRSEEVAPCPGGRLDCGG